jgi:hypothetical protein
MSAAQDAEIAVAAARLAIGNAIAGEIRVAVAAFWAEWAVRYPNMSAERKWELQRELDGIIEAARLHATPVSGGVESKGGTIAVTQDGTKQNIEEVCSTATPLPDAPVGDPGGHTTDKTPPFNDHVHPLVPASTLGGKLWTAWVQDAKQMDAVDCIYSGGFSGWTQIGTGAWQCNTAGKLSSSVLDGLDAATVTRVLDAADGVQAGIYDLLNAGAGPMPLYFEADGSLGQTPPLAPGILTATIVDRGASIALIAGAGYPGLQVWPGRIEGVGDSPVPVTIACRMTGSVLPDQTYTLKVQLYRRTTGGALTEYTDEMGQGDFPIIPSDGSWRTITLTLQAEQLSSGSTSDVLECLCNAFLAAGTDADGATFEIAYGGTGPNGLTVPLPTYPTLRRSADSNATADFSNGMFCLVNGGSVHAGQTWQATLPSPFELGVTSQAWAPVTPPTPQPTNELLTAPELPLASPTLKTASATVSASTGEVELVVCTAHDDAGGITILGTGIWRTHCQIANFVADGTTSINVYTRGNAHTPWNAIGSVTLSTTDYGNFVAVGTLGTDYPLAPGEKTQVRFTVVSTSTAGVTVTLIYNDGPHSTYLEVPMTVGFAGTDDHQQLSNRGVFLTSGGSAKYAHPQGAIEPGVVHSPCGDVITTAAGLFTMPDSNTAHIDGGEPLIGIANATASGIAWEIGDCITVWIAQSRIVQGDGFSAGDHPGFSPLYLPPAAFVDPTNPSAGPQAQAAADDFIDLMFSGLKWMHKSSSLG